jgi:cytochrome P450
LAHQGRLIHMSTYISIVFVEATGLTVIAASAFVRAASRPLARMFPRVFAALAAGLVLWIALVSGLALRFPTMLHALTTLAMLGVAVTAWRNRAGYGRSRGLPPGSLSLTTSLEALVDRDFYRKQAARHGPVFKMAQFHQPVVCVVGLSRGHQLLHQHQDALGPSTQRFSQYIPGGFLRYMTDRTHETYAPLFRQALSAQVVAQSWPVIQDAARHELERAAADAWQTGTGSVPPDAYLSRIVTAAFFRTLFGISPGTPAFDRVLRAYRPLAPIGLSARLTRTSLAALDELRRVITEQHEQWRRQSQSDEIPVCALNELGRLDPRMPDATSVDNLIYIHKISSSNVLSLLRWLLVTVGRHPAWIARLRSELEMTTPSPGGAPPLVQRIIMETLRLSQAEYLYRRLRKDVAYDEFTLPKGWLVRICVWESHRQADLFEDAERFNPDRFLARDYSPSTYSPFGADRHACNGVPLTNAICRAVVEQITRQYEWGVECDEDLDRDFRHWSHWRPSARLRLRLAPIPAQVATASATDRG